MPGIEKGREEVNRTQRILRAVKILHLCANCFSHVRLCNPMDCSLPGSSIHGILQAWILKWVAISSSRRSSWPTGWTWVLCIMGGLFTTEPPGRPQNTLHVPNVEYLSYIYLSPYNVQFQEWTICKLWALG